MIPFSKFGSHKGEKHKSEELINMKYCATTPVWFSQPPVHAALFSIEIPDPLALPGNTEIIPF